MLGSFSISQLVKALTERTKATPKRIPARPAVTNQKSHVAAVRDQETKPTVQPGAGQDQESVAETSSFPDLRLRPRDSDKGHYFAWEEVENCFCLYVPLPGKAEQQGEESAVASSPPDLPRSDVLTAQTGPHVPLPGPCPPASCGGGRRAR